jgi:hypothetical protein
MPESEPKPRPLEAVTSGSGQGWKATLRNGKQAVVHEISVAPAVAAAAAPRMQRLAEHPHPSLSPILAWGTDAGGVWVAVEPNEGTPLSAVLARGRFTPHAAAALGTAVLSGIAVLHEAGVAMGGFDASAVRLTSNGEVRLAGHPVAAVRGAPSQGDLRADVRSCGMAICAAFGVDPSGAPAPPELAPGLVVTMRSMASGAMGPAVDRAQGALREMAGPLLAPDRQLAAQSELALRAGGREMPSITPFVPEAPKSVEETPAPRAASYDPPARAVETYSGIPAFPARPVETYSPPSAYQSAPPAPAPVEPPVPVPVPEPPAPVAPPEPAPPPAAHSFEAPAVAAAAAAALWEAQPSTPSPAPASAFASSPPMPAAPPEPAAIPFEPQPSTYEPPAPAAPFAPAVPVESTWTPRETGEWTPGPPPSGRVSSSEWTGEATPAPAPVPEELRSPRITSAYSTAPPVTNPPIPRAAASAPARKPAPRRPAGDMLSGRPGWLIPAAIAVVVLLLLGIGAVVLTHRGGTTNPQAQTSPHASASPKASASPTNAIHEPTAVAPFAAAPLASVQFCQSSDPCKFGTTQDFKCELNSSCHIDLGIYLNANASQVTYQVQFFDRCTGETRTLFGPKTDHVNNQRAWLPAPVGGWPVTLPSAKAAVVYIVVTVTGTSTTIQSQFYTLPGSADSC